MAHSSNMNGNEEAISRSQREWEQMLQAYKKEREDLQMFIRIKQAQRQTSPELDEAKLRRVQLEMIMKRHFAYAYQVTYLVDVVKKYEAKDDVNEYLPP